MSEYSTRFNGAPYMKVAKKMVITLIGNGGIGSWLGIDLARVGVARIMNYEYDTIDISNIGGQNFEKNDINKEKAVVMADMAYRRAGYHHWLNLGEFTAISGMSEIVFCCVDSNDVRRIIFDAWVADCEKNGWYSSYNVMDGEDCNTIKVPKVLIDARMSFDSYNVYCVTEKDYVNHGLYRIPPSDTIADDSCSTKSNPDIGKAAAADQLRVWKNVIDNSLAAADGIDFDVVSAPYCITYDKNYFTCIKEERCNIPSVN